MRIHIDFDLKKLSRAVAVFLAFCLMPAAQDFLCAEEDPPASSAAVSPEETDVVLPVEKQEGPGNTEEERASEPAGGEIIVDGEEVVYWDDEQRITGKGKVVVRHKEMRLYADEATVYLATNDAYARGNVRLEEKGRIVKGESLTYNFDTEKGTLADADAKFGPWYGKGSNISKTSADEYVTDRGYVTTCDKEVPHYRIKARQIRVIAGERVTARHVIFYAGGTPLVYLPYYSQTLKDSPLSVVPGHNRDWGTFLLTSYKHRLENDDALKLHLDYRSKRGFAEGLDYEYMTDDFGHGEMKFYTMTDTGSNNGEPYTEDRDRYRVQAQHRWLMDKNTDLTAEYNKYRDITFIKDFFRPEYERDSQPESRIWVTRREDDYDMSFLVRGRTMDFYTETEKLPELKLNIRPQQVGDTRFLYTGEDSMANMNLKRADSDLETSAARLDTFHKLSYPAPLPWLHLRFTPYAGVRETFYTRDRDKTDENFLRGVFYTGYDLSTRFWRIYDVHKEQWGIEVNQLRHLIIPGVTHAYIHDPTVNAAKLEGFDGIDAIDKTNVLTLQLDNVLQTKWKAGNEETPSERVDLARLLAKIDFYPRERPSSLRSDFADLIFQFDLKPYRWLSFDTDARYDHVDGHFDSVNTDIYARKDNWEFDFEHRYSRDTSTQETFDVKYTPWENWSFALYERYDFKTQRLYEQEYRIIRDLHCWTVEFTFNETSAEPSFWIIFRLKGFPDELVKAKSGSNSSKITPYVPPR